MKLILQILFVLGMMGLPSSLHAQNGTIVNTTPIGPETISDTVTAGQLICLDSAVTSFVVDMSINGPLISQSYHGCCFVLTRRVKPGTKIYVSQIISEPQKGNKVKLPGRQFYVR